MKTDKVKQYFWFVFGVIGVVFFWAGVWDGLGSLPYVKIWWVSLLIGLLMFVFSGIILKGSALFGGGSDPLLKVVHNISRHPEKHLFQIKYVDKLRKKTLSLRGHEIRRLEKNFIVFMEGNQERFIPFHRVTEILHKGKTHWKP